MNTVSDRKERGATLVLVAVCLVGITGVGAVAIDLGMLLKARNEAQRAAEAGALAGASAFREYAASDPQAIDSAAARARRFAEANTILDRPVAPAEVQPPQIISDSQKVRVTVQRPQVGTWFARILGVNAVPIGARAAAMATYAGTGKCVKPFAVPDTWNERDATQDPNGNHLQDEGEDDWSYDPAVDDYQQGNPDSPNGGQTGYGSELRNDNGDYVNDSGRELVLTLPVPPAAGNGGPPVAPYTGPLQFQPFSPGGSTDPADYREAIEGCDPSQVSLGEPYPLMPPSDPLSDATKEGIDSLFSTDPDARWDSEKETITDSRYADWRNSPRTIKVGLFNPEQIGLGSIEFNNFGLMFVEGFDRTTNQLSGRLFYFAPGTGDPEAGTGTLVKHVRLVE
jgi:putative Flp pilus-assembly TadE/G-like protein